MLTRASSHHPDPWSVVSGGLPIRHGKPDPKSELRLAWACRPGGEEKILIWGRMALFLTEQATTCSLVKPITRLRPRSWGGCCTRVVVEEVEDEEERRRRRRRR